MAVTPVSPAVVLVVEDEPAIATAVANRLAAEGWTVEVAGDGHAGVEAAARLHPQLVVLDVMLPGIDGLEVCRRIQAERAVPVLMLTARDDETDMLIGLGVSRLLDKNSYQSFRLPKQRAGFAYTVGLAHGLAGSAALVLAVLSAIAQPAWAMAYILLFGLGSVLGMLVAVSLMRLPFTLRMQLGRRLRAGAVVLSSALSVGYGGWLVWTHV